MFRSRLTTTAALCAAVILAASGCSDNPSPTPRGEDATVDDIRKNIPKDIRDAIDELRGKNDGSSGEVGNDDPSGEVGNEYSGSDSGSADDEGSDGWDYQPLRFQLPEQGSTPDGWQRVPVSCDAPGGDSVTDEGLGAINVAVPDGWTYEGYSGGGDGYSESYQAHFRPSESNSNHRYSIQLEPDPTLPDGTLTDGFGEPTDGAFDYDYTTNDETTTITFEPVTTVAIGEQDVDILVAHQDQAPDILSSTAYQARFSTVDIPNPAVDSGYRPLTSVITISVDLADDQTPLTDDDAVAIISSLQMPPCAVEAVVISEEAQAGVDLNEDGYISTIDDFKKMMLGRN